MRILAFFLIIYSITSQATIWTVKSFEENCVNQSQPDPKTHKIVYGETIHEKSDGENTVKCMLGDYEESSVRFDNLKQMIGYSRFHRSNQFVLYQEIFDKNGKLDNKEVYLPYKSEGKQIYFRVNSKGEILEGHFMRAPDQIIVVPNANVIIANGQTLTQVAGEEVLKRKLVNAFNQETKDFDYKKKPLSDLINHINGYEMNLHSVDSLIPGGKVNR